MIAASDIKVYLSGGAGNADPNASLGGAISSTELVSNSVNNLFALAPAAEADAGSVKYRAVFVKNTHATLTLISPKVYIASNTPSPTTAVKIGLALETGSPIDTIANEDTAPDPAVTFVTAADFANGISLGNLAPGETKGIWIEYTINAGTGAVADQLTITAKGESEA